MEGLAEAVRRWHEEGIRSDALLRPLRLVLQLAPIVRDHRDGTGGLTTPTAWSLHYAVHDPERPAGPIAAEDLWADPDEGYGVTLRRLLEQAARVFAPIGRTLDEAEPVECELTPDEAAEFVYQAADRLSDGACFQLRFGWAQSSHCAAAYRRSRPRRLPRHPFRSMAVAIGDRK